MNSLCILALVELLASASAMVLKTVDGNPVKVAVSSIDDTAHGRVSRQTPSTCTDGFEKVPESTMCLTDSPDYIDGTAGVNATDKAHILALHNAFRSGVKPTARAMTKMYWDDDLAKVAEKWAKQCYVGHESDLGKSRFIPAHGMESGQNGGFGYPNWEQTVTAWHDEVSDFVYGEGSKNGAVVGHYTQIVQEKSILVGCGFAKCNSGYKNFYFCNYLDAQYNIRTPYTSGKPCSGCSGKCGACGKLCDCNGKFCFNGGTLDLNTCQCACKTPFIGSTCRERACDGKVCENGGTLDVDTCKCQCTELYSGQNCQTKNCPAEDPEHCGTQWPKSYCDTYINVPDSCPHMCGKC